MRGQDRTHRHVGHITTFPLVKADQDLAFFAHIFDRQSGAKAVSPIGSLDGSEDGLGLHMAQVCEQIFQNALFDGHLSRGIGVLHFASPARARVESSMGAFWRYPERGVFDDLGERGFFPIVFFAVDVGHHHLKGQGPIDKHHFAVLAVRNALRIQVHGLNVQPLGWFRCGCVGHVGVFMQSRSV